jgi:hypothetical protein
MMFTHQNQLNIQTAAINQLGDATLKLRQAAAKFRSVATIPGLAVHDVGFLDNMLLQARALEEATSLLEYKAGQRRQAAQIEVDKITARRDRDNMRKQHSRNTKRAVAGVAALSIAPLAIENGDDAVPGNDPGETEMEEDVSLPRSGDEATTDTGGSSSSAACSPTASSTGLDSPSSGSKRSRRDGQ